KVFDVTARTPTVADFLNHANPTRQWWELPRDRPLGSLREVVQKHSLLAPCDIQAIKACGVTFVRSLLQRVLQDRAPRDPQRADALRTELEKTLGSSLEQVVPGSSEALRLKERLVELGYWSQYLEVGIGPDAEVFTKAQPLSAVGAGQAIGILPQSQWNNP